MEPSPLPHVMLVSYPGQGHISPLLRLGTLIASKGLIVTFVTTEQPWGKKMRQANKIQEGVLKPVGLGFLRFEFFSDGLTDDDEKRTDFNAFRPNIEAVGKQEIKNLVKRYNKESVTCLINNAYVPWVCDVAEELQIPSAVLWVQSCACLSAYYYYHHGLVKFPTKTEPDIDVEIPCLPLLKHDEIPSFLHTSSPYTPYGEVILDQFKRLENDKPFYLFIDTFRELEKDIIDHMSNLCPQAIISPVGPLFKMAETISSDVKGDISEPASDSNLKQEQMEEIAHGVLSSGLSFLWVVRPPMEGSLVEPHVLPRELEEMGKIVEWCPQERVLAHPAIAYFLSHCGWNSTMEALTSGVPVVCFPQWGDQVTDDVYLVDVFKP
ncbi:hypothetical protein ARALYDRAFT_915253 [Arabidopsis lyrata subsp. lyrata]|uniref:Glycosyltransferase n=1 Tax=Arabidopsis lyrata subsp. lyrata TaxID=81972 RepID=D7MAH3_ARALL|nr:hypothetical protein ARALYDRAFT_915253 [Arabidopsis lyrata subsp. lyrata]